MPGKRIKLCPVRDVIRLDGLGFGSAGDSNVSDFVRGRIIHHQSKSVITLTMSYYLEGCITSLYLGILSCKLVPIFITGMSDSDMVTIYFPIIRNRTDGFSESKKHIPRMFVELYSVVHSKRIKINLPIMDVQQN